MFLITTVQGYLKPCSKQLKCSVTLYPPLPYIDYTNLSIEGISVERKHRCDGRTGGGVACYTRNSFMYKILSNLEENELEVIWLKIMPKQLPRKCSCILIACIYFIQMTEYICQNARACNNMCGQRYSETPRMRSQNNRII